MLKEMEESGSSEIELDMADMEDDDSEFDEDGSSDDDDEDDDYERVSVLKLYSHQCFDHPIFRRNNLFPERKFDLHYLFSY